MKTEFTFLGELCL